MKQVTLILIIFSVFSQAFAIDKLPSLPDEQHFFMVYKDLLVMPHDTETFERLKGDGKGRALKTFNLDSHIFQSVFNYPKGTIARVLPFQGEKEQEKFVLSESYKVFLSLEDSRIYIALNPTAYSDSTYDPNISQEDKFAYLGSNLILSEKVRMSEIKLSPSKNKAPVFSNAFPLNKNTNYFELSGHKIYVYSDFPEERILIQARSGKNYLIYGLLSKSRTTMRFYNWVSGYQGTFVRSTSSGKCPKLLFFNEKDVYEVNLHCDQH